MARIIHRYEWNGKSPSIDIDMPKGAMPIAVKADQGYKTFSVWAVVDLGQPVTPRKFVALQDKATVPNGNVSFIGTVMLDEGYTVLHVFEVMAST